MDKRQQLNSQWTFKAIVKDKDNWAAYQTAYADQVTPHQIAEVEKMLGCGDPANGYATYICLKCGETKQVCFSCKSRVCSACGKVHADEWAAQMSSRMFNVTHRHITFTVPDVLWPILERYPAGRKVLYGAAHRTLRKVLEGEPGIVMVLHPYGKDLKVNYHVHVVVTEGGLNEAEEWVAQPFLSYYKLRKIWQYECLTELRSVLPAERETRRLIDRLFKQYTNGFYVHAEAKVENGPGISRYIGRYIRHPAIADTRIVAYDGINVTFYYEDHQGRRHEQTLPVLEFMHGVVRHIPPKHFKMVRCFGLYAPRKAAQVRTIMQQIGKKIGRVVRRLGWRQRIKRDFERDPLECPRCGVAGMELYSLTIRWRGQLKTFGGLKWLFERGCLLNPADDDPRPDPLPPQPPRAQQLALGLSVTGRV
jgi:hypothetical protein